MEYAEYTALYPGEGPEEESFDRFQWLARHVMDRACTGADGVRKLTAYPPTETCAAEAVRRCEAALIRRLWRDERQEGLMDRPDGSVAGRVVTSLAAGSEKITYAQPAATPGLDAEAALWGQIRQFLEGVSDANGVPLLYMGPYPARRG